MPIKEHYNKPYDIPMFKFKIYIISYTKMKLKWRIKLF